MRMTDFALTVLMNPSTGDAHAAARHVWKSEIEFQDSKDLLKLSIDHSRYAASLECLLQICLAHAKRSVEGVESTLPHLQIYKNWVQSTVALKATDEDLLSVIQSQADSLSAIFAASAAQAMTQISVSIVKILTEELQALDVLEKNDVLNKIQNFIKDFDISEFLLDIAHNKLKLRVLELRVGNGSSTVNILKHLTRSFSKYVFTDFSSNLFDLVKEHLAEFRKVLDVFEKFQTRQQDAVFDPEMEYAVLNGQVNIGRLYSHSLSEEPLITEPNDNTVLAIDRPGRVDGLYWERRAAESAKTDQVEIEVYYTGLSYKVSVSYQ